MIVAAACSSGATKSTGTSTTSATSATTAASAGDPTTTVVGAATTIVEAATTLPAATVAPTTTTVVGTFTPAKDIPTGWVSGALPGDPVVNAAAGECDAFYAASATGPYTQSHCGVWNATSGQRTWSVTRAANGFLIGIIWQQTAPNSWVPLLRALETTAGQWSDITIVAGNVDTGPGDELVSGTRIAGASGKLAVVVIDIRADNPRVVAVHPTGNHGVAVLHAGVGIEVWSAVEGADIPKCCPTQFVLSFLEFVDGGWVVETRGTAPAGDPSIPDSEF